MPSPCHVLQSRTRKKEGVYHGRFSVVVYYVYPVLAPGAADPRSYASDMVNRSSVQNRRRSYWRSVLTGVGTRNLTFQAAFLQMVGQGQPGLRRTVVRSKRFFRPTRPTWHQTILFYISSCRNQSLAFFAYWYMNIDRTTSMAIAKSSPARLE